MRHRLQDILLVQADVPRQPDIRRTSGERNNIIPLPRGEELRAGDVFPLGTGRQRPLGIDPGCGHAGYRHQGHKRARSFDAGDIPENGSIRASG